MTITEIGALLKERFGDKVEEVHSDERHGHVRVARETLVETCRLLRDDPRTKFEQCHDVTAVDWIDYFEVVLHLYSLSRKHACCVKVRTPSRADADCPSVTSIWPAADWHERETWDLLGIRFTGTPDLRRILLPEDWQGHPLRKDEGNPLEYHGIPGIAAIRGAEERLREDELANQHQRSGGSPGPNPAPLVPGVPALSLAEGAAARAERAKAAPLPAVVASASPAAPAAPAAPKAPGSPPLPGAPKPPAPSPSAGAPKAPPLPPGFKMPSPPKPPSPPSPPAGGGA